MLTIKREKTVAFPWKRWLRELACFLTETKKCTLAKLFNYAILFNTPTSFGHSCDHLKGVVQ
jgi:hypothetical protein